MKAPVISVDDTRPWSEVEAEFSEFGYWYNDIDHDLARSVKCPKCGGRMDYEGRTDGQSRHAFAVCETCDLASEF